MKHKSLLVITVLSAALGMTSVYAASTPPSSASATPPVGTTLSTEKKHEIQQIIHDYLIENPEVLMEASQALQRKQQIVMQAQAQSAIAKSARALVRGNLTVAGNPKGDVTLVEFYDYQCGHCKSMEPIVKSLIKENSNLRVVYKEFPIFGKESDMASSAAIVAAMQGKFTALQEKLFKVDKHLDEATILELAKQVGLNMNTFKSDIESKAVKSILEENRKLAESIHLMGTPAFIILATHDGHYHKGAETVFVPGASTQEALQESINRLAGKKVAEK